MEQTGERSRTFTWSDPAINAAHLGRRSGLELLRAMIGGELPAGGGGLTVPAITLRPVDVMDGQQEITYWIDRSAWGQGVASRAVALLLDLVPVRPLHARAASDNAGSLAVLRRAGFRIVGTD